MLCSTLLTYIVNDKDPGWIAKSFKIFVLFYVGFSLDSYSKRPSSLIGNRTKSYMGADASLVLYTLCVFDKSYLLQTLR